MEYMAKTATTASRRLTAWGTPAFQSAALAHLAVVLAVSPLDALSQAFQRWARFDLSHRLTCIVAERTVAMPVALDSGLVAEGADKFVDLSMKQTIEVAEGMAHLYLFTRVLAQSSPALARAAVLVALGGSALALRLGGDLPDLFRRERAAQDAVNEHLARCRDHEESINFYAGRDREVQRAAALDMDKLASADARKARKDQVELLSSLVRRVFGDLPMFTLTTASASSSTLHAAHTHGHSHAGALAKADDDDDKKGATAADFALLNQASTGFDEMLLHLLVVAENFNDFTRLHSLAVDICAALDYRAPKGNVVVKELQPDNDTWLVMRDLHVATPGDEATLIAGLQLSLARGESLLVAGPSGCGKTALCRVLCGIWTAGSGELQRPPLKDIFFLPQKAYCPLDATLREQALYPRTNADDAAVLSALDAVGLAATLQRLGAGLDTRLHSWGATLSMGEVQRLAFARLLLARPLYGVLDEATSACDM